MNSSLLLTRLEQQNTLCSINIFILFLLDDDDSYTSDAEDDYLPQKRKRSIFD